MNLLQIRTKFVELTGRFDLVKDTVSYVDNGANFFIEAGQRFIDSKIDFPKSVARYQKDITAGKILLTFQNARAIREIWVTNSEGKNQLTKKTMTWLRNNYRGALSSLEKGQPLYYTPAIIGLSPQQKDLTAENYMDEFTYDVDDLMFGAHFGYNGVLFMPPADGTYTMTVIADFFSAIMTEDTETNYWSEMYPDLLVAAAMLALEKFYRNTEGVKDMNAVVMDALAGIDRDNAEQEIAGVNIMERSS